MRPTATDPLAGRSHNAPRLIWFRGREGTFLSGRRSAALLIALAAACGDDKPSARTVPLSEAPEAKGLKDKTAPAAPPEPEVPEVPDAGAGEDELPPGKVWLAVPRLGVDVGVAPEVTIARSGAQRGEVLLTDGKSQLRMRRVASRGGDDKQAIIDRLTREGGGKIGLVVNRSEEDGFRLEYVIKDKKSGLPLFGMVVRRTIGDVTIECTNRGSETSSNQMALEACHAMRATPP